MSAVSESSEARLLGAVHTVDEGDHPAHEDREKSSTTVPALDRVIPRAVGVIDDVPPCVEGEAEEEAGKDHQG